MKFYYYIILLFTVSLSSQSTIDATLVKDTIFNVDTFVAADTFGTVFSITNNTLYKNSEDNPLNYSNIQLGEITSTNTFNPLKINVFYKDFNTVIILDNRLAEVYKIDFNTSENYRNITRVSTGSDTTIWIFNQDTQQLELFDYKTNKARAKTLPIQDKVIAMTSNYNYCWVLTESQLLVYNYTGSLLNKIENNHFIALSESNNTIILSTKNKLYYLDNKNNSFNPISIPNLLINQFFVTNEIAYIYSNNKLYKYQLKLN